MAEHRFTTHDAPILRVSIPSGQVEIRTVDGDDSVVLVDGDDRLVDATTVELDGRTIVVSFAGAARFGLWPLPRFGRDTRLRVRATVPHGARARVNTASADVGMEGRIGAIDVTTASGDVAASGEVEGDAAIKTVSGDVRLERIGGALRCQTVSGNVDVRWVGGSVTARSVSGDVRVETLREGSARFTSVSGDVEIGIAEGSLLDIDAGSVSGRMTSEVPLASVPAADGATGPIVVLRGKTVSGDVKVLRAHRDGATGFLNGFQALAT